MILINLAFMRMKSFGMKVTRMIKCSADSHVKLRVLFVINRRLVTKCPFSIALCLCLSMSLKICVQQICYLVNVNGFASL